MVQNSNRILMLVTVAPALGLAVLLLHLLGLEEGGVGELLNIRNVVVLSYVNPAHRSYYEREAASYDPHLPTRRKNYN